MNLPMERGTAKAHPAMIETVLPWRNDLGPGIFPRQPTQKLERLYREQRLAASYRLFARFAFDLGGAGHFTVRDPEHTDCFWLKPAGVVLDTSEGAKIGNERAVILQNYGLLTVGQSVEAGAWRYIALENACQLQLLADAAGTARPMPLDLARLTSTQVGTERGPLYSLRPY